ncbi:MAG: hypothetical protein ACK4L7_02625 [Flavobacteriales bacterium]
MSINRVICALPVLIIALVGCRKDDDKRDRDLSAATDQSRAEDVFADMLAVVDQAVKDNGLRDLCDPAVTFDTSATPRTITIDFGDVNCTAGNGRSRRGRILVSYTGRYRDPGTVITITPEDYHVNDNHVTGVKTVTNMGLNANDQPWFTVSMDGAITAADGSWTATHQAQRTRTWIEGFDTPALQDDVYEITGSGSGVNRNGVSYTSEITQALRVELGCAWRMVSGRVTITPSGRLPRTIDYGDGSCDATFTVTEGWQPFRVTRG